MKHETPHWGARTLDADEADRSRLRISIAAELPETRIFIDRLYHEFTASGRRFHAEQIMQKRGNHPWFFISNDDDA